MGFELAGNHWLAGWKRPCRQQNAGFCVHQDWANANANGMQCNVCCSPFVSQASNDGAKHHAAAKASNEQPAARLMMMSQVHSNKHAQGQNGAPDKVGGKRRP